MAPANQTTPISTSDTCKQMMDEDDKGSLSTSSSRSVIEAVAKQGAIPVASIEDNLLPAQVAGTKSGQNFNKNNNNKSSSTVPGEVAIPSFRPSSSNHQMESTRRQQDREFFKRFLQPVDNQCEAAMGNLGETRNGGSGGNNKPPVQWRQDGLMAPGASLDHALFMSASRAPGLSANFPPWTPACALPLMYSTFGNTNFPADRPGASLGVSGGESTISSSFYDNNNGLNPAGGRIFSGGGGLLDSYNHLFAPSATLVNESASNSSSDLGAQSKSPLADFNYQRGDLNAMGAGRTYSSVLNNNNNNNNSVGDLGHSLLEMARRRSAAQTTKPQTSDLIATVDLQDPASLIGFGSSGRQLNSHQARLLSEFLASTTSAHLHLQQQQLQQQQQQHSYDQMMASTGPHYPPAGGGVNLNSSFQLGGHWGPNRDSAMDMLAPHQRGAAGHRSASDRSGPQQLAGGSSVASAAFSKRRNKLPSSLGSATTTAAAAAVAGPVNDHGARQVANAHGQQAIAGSSLEQPGGERFSRKVFVGGLPPDIDEEEIKASFRRFGALVVDWPHKAESKSYFPPKGYAFLLFQEEGSVQVLIDSCFQEEDKLYLCVSSPTIKDKPVQIRPWRLSDTDYVLDSTLALDPRKTVFVGGVPRPLKAAELANIMNQLYGSVCYAGIDTDPELKYPKGAGRVAFSTHQSYIAAISARFVHIHHGEIEKRVEVKPYVLDDQFCDECQGSRCANKFAPFFCANITCLRYYCESCWSSVHSQAGREFHKPLVKEGGDRPRGAQSFRW